MTLIHTFENNISKQIDAISVISFGTYGTCLLSIWKQKRSSLLCSNSFIKSARMSNENRLLSRKHCTIALKQTRACLDSEHYIALAIMCGVTAERFMNFEKKQPIKKVASYIWNESKWDENNKKIADEIQKIRNDASHGEHAVNFDSQAQKKP